MPKYIENGFTLIELMMVVAIIGILAAVAIPAYQDYTVGARISEAASVSSPARMALGIACNEGRLAGANNVNLGLAQPASISGQYVSSVTAGPCGGALATAFVACVLVVLNQSNLGSDDITASTNEIRYQGQCDSMTGTVWTVSSGSTLPRKFWPKT